jgi:hypothetical protein
MANEIKTVYKSGSTVYAVILSPSIQVWNGSTFENLTSMNWTTYKIALTEQIAGIFIGSIPSGIVTSGTYMILIYLQAGGTPTVTDIPVGGWQTAWSGTGEVSSLNAQLDMTQAVPASNTAESLGDALNAARADGFGKWDITVDGSGNPTGITLYAGDNATVVKTFAITSPTGHNIRA